MTRILTRLAQAHLRRQDYSVVHNSQYRSDLPNWFWKHWQEVEDWTLTSPERGFGLAQAVQWIEQAGIPGDIVECGVYKGGSAMLAARILLQENPQSRRQFWLYDTFQGMPQPGAEDRTAYSGQAMVERWQEGWWQASIDLVSRGMRESGLPMDQVHLVKGDVTQTLPTTKPESIALLRLDTDWYESTKAELEILYPRLSPRGILIIDDYGHFTGARKAVDEYFAAREISPIFHRLDYTGRMVVKPEGE
ncbi:TylF/MycF/NovP-related O-methyltransferase [Spirochaeta lutea]|uniref:Macrocin-O-methyltransferase n=1 Tax=Spirochaeta lutea TaxID=1480694 RepID=A0A098QWK3_9SPIO|nr:TylF/MycF/NovP-related O-methyltransferase [Spirochaeta lutea]KGE70827.1 hypothetical protein DC28_15205 [Spirochaeta lutea]